MTALQERSVLWQVSEGLVRDPSGDLGGRACMKWPGGDASLPRLVGKNGATYGGATMKRMRYLDPPADWEPTDELRETLKAQVRAYQEANFDLYLRKDAVRFADLAALKSHILAGRAFPDKIIVGEDVYFGGSGGTNITAGTVLAGNPCAVVWEPRSANADAVVATFRVRFCHPAIPLVELHVLYAREHVFSGQDRVAAWWKRIEEEADQ